MTFDFTKTLALVKGGLFDHQATWKSYLEENPDWQYTATVLAGPLIVANIVLSGILSRMLGGYSYLPYHSNFFSALIWGLVMAGIGFTISVFVFNFLAGVFKGNSNFARALAAVSLAAIPSWVAGVVGALVPSFAIGGLIVLAGGITSLVFMYKIMPLALGLPDDKRVAHFVVSLISIIILNMIVGSVIGVGSLSSNLDRDLFSADRTTSSALTGSGVLGEFERQGRLMEAAEDDTYDPPDDGELDESQVVAYTKVLKKTRAIHEEYAEKMQKFSAEMEAKKKAGEEPSMGDLSKAYSGIGGVMGANNAEMEVVKTGGGNWAEHVWIKEQLRIARIQQGDGSDALAHNYKLFRKYEEDLD